jgi:hypothetical protein
MRSTQTHQHTAHNGIEVAQRKYVYTHGVCGLRAFTDRSQMQTRARAVHKIPRDGDEKVHHVRKDIPIED